jgi:putative membrane protein
MKDYLKTFIKGICMGAADIIPGISGGTIALITGIYERLIKGLAAINLNFLKPLLHGNFSHSYDEIKKIDFALFIPLGLGIILAILLMANLMDYLLTNFEPITYAFFFGLILGSAILILKDIRNYKVNNILILLIGSLIGFILTIANTISFSNSLYSVFALGFIAICAMILPGISGSFILVLFGKYKFIINSLIHFDFWVISVFGLGALFGIIIFSRLLKILLSKFKVQTLYFLVGLMFGALNLPLNKFKDHASISVFIFLAIGLIITIFLKKLSKDI